MGEPALDRWMTKAEACRYVRVSAGTFDKLMSEGRLPPPIYLTARLPRWDRNAIDQHMQSAMSAAPSEDHAHAAQTAARNIAARRAARRASPR